MEFVYIRRIGLKLWKAERVAKFACCGIRDKTSVPIKLKWQVIARGTQGIFICGIHSNFGTCIEIFPSVESGTKRHQIVSFSSAHLDFVIAGQCFLVDHRAPQTSDVSIERRRHIDRFTTASLYIFFWIFFQYVIYGTEVLLKNAFNPDLCSVR